MGLVGAHDNVRMPLISKLHITEVANFRGPPNTVGNPSSANHLENTTALDYFHEKTPFPPTVHRWTDAFPVI